MGSADRPTTPADASAAIASLGTDGRRAMALAAEIDRRISTLAALSEITTSVALDYLDRIGRPLAPLTATIGARTTTAGYVAHMAVEDDPEAYGAADIPVLGTLPALRAGRPPQDLSSRVVKATRRNFDTIRAVSAGVWNGLVVLTTAAVHRQARACEEGPESGAGGWLEADVVDALLRFGWVLRQVDLHYGLAPEPAG